MIDHKLKKQAHISSTLPSGCSSIAFTTSSLSFPLGSCSVCNIWKAAAKAVMQRLRTCHVVKNASTWRIDLPHFFPCVGTFRTKRHWPSLCIFICSGNVFGDKLNGVSNATRRKTREVRKKKTKKKILEDGKKSLGASQLLFDGGLFILSNLGNLCGALEGLVKATEFGDKKGTKRHFPHTSTDKWQYLAKEVSDCDEKGCGDLRIPWGVRIWKWKRLIFCLTN